MLNLTNYIKKIFAVVSIAVTLLFAIEAPSQAAPQSLEIPSILRMDSIELAATPKSELGQPVTENNLLAEATAKGEGCGRGRWCCHFPSAGTYHCMPCRTSPCKVKQKFVCETTAGGETAPDKKCN